MLLTDRKRNLGRIFNVGSEVIDFASVDECAERITWALANDAERKTTAARGQARTLKDHTFRSRMEEFLRILQEERSLPNPGEIEA